MKAKMKNSETRGLLKDIQARAKEIKYHYKTSTASAVTPRLCEDIICRSKVARSLLEADKPKCDLLINFIADTFRQHDVECDTCGPKKMQSYEPADNLCPHEEFYVCPKIAQIQLKEITTDDICDCEFTHGGRCKWRAEIAQLKAEIDGYKEWATDVKRLTKAISDILTPKDGPEQPSLCDVVAYVKDDFAQLQTKLNLSSVLLENRDKRVAQLKAQIQEHEESEGAVCPEDVGFVEYIKSLKTQLKELKEESKQLSALTDSQDKNIAGLEEKRRWIPVKEGLPEIKEDESQSVWVDVTNGKEKKEAYLYDYTKRAPKPGMATGKGWYVQGLRSNDITHFRYITLPEGDKK